MSWQSFIVPGAGTPGRTGDDLALARVESTDRVVVAVGLAVVAGAALARPVPAMVLGAAAVLVIRRRASAIRWAVALGLIASWNGARHVASLVPPERAPLHAWVRLVDEPQRFGAGVSVAAQTPVGTVLLGGWGGTARSLTRFHTGEYLLVDAEVRPLRPDERGRWRSAGVVGRAEVDVILDHADGSPLDRSTLRVRRALTAGSAVLGDDRQALFLGMVIGDDQNQPEATRDRFRRVGLSHLTAVSGQNVAFVLAVASPLLRRLRPTPRWVATLGLIGWFAALTRFEPSVLRAASMSALAATTFWRGWHASGVRLLAVAVGGFLLISPLLVTSVGWWMSVGATAGIVLGAGPITERLPGPRPVAAAVGVTLAAQLGVTPISFAVFGTAALWSPLTNALAVPVAGWVMVWGIPAGLLAGLVPATAPVVHLPSSAGLAWVDTVARLADRAEPGWPPGLVVTLQVAVVALAMVWTRRIRRARPAGQVGSLLDVGPPAHRR
ncbi:MAG: ComEC/Rec2 family competence protein [Ilumatobacteraceae bacterium]